MPPPQQAWSSSVSTTGGGRGGTPKAVACLCDMFFQLGRLVCPQWARMGLARKRLDVSGWGHTKAEAHSLRGEGSMGEGFWEGVTGSWSVSRV